jgi:hypothetical protein
MIHICISSCAKELREVGTHCGYGRIGTIKRECGNVIGILFVRRTNSLGGKGYGRLHGISHFTYPFSYVHNRYDGIRRLR